MKALAGAIHAKSQAVRSWLPSDHVRDTAGPSWVENYFADVLDRDEKPFKTLLDGDSSDGDIGPRVSGMDEINVCLSGDAIARFMECTGVVVYLIDESASRPLVCESFTSQPDRCLCPCIDPIIPRQAQPGLRS